jgi:hypothetical protein
VLDKGVKNSLEVQRILNEVLPRTPVTDSDQSAANSEDSLDPDA